MGIIFERNISRLSEAGTFPPLDPAQGLNFLTQTRTLHFTDIKHYTLLELLPAVTYGKTSLNDQGTLEPQNGKSDFSLTAKYGLTSQLVLDGTVNPDFSQVESDAGGRYQTEVFLGQRFNRSGFRFIGTSQITKQFSLDVQYIYGDKIRYIAAPHQGRGNDASLSMIYLPSDNFHFEFALTYSDFTRSTDGVKEYDYTILRSLNTYQVNKYLFFRAIVEYNSFRKQLMTDLLASFTYIPGTVIHIGYGSLYKKLTWRDGMYEPSDRFLEMRRGFFFKASYLWRL
ncbi:MAG: hypothetical protein WCC06_11360 [Candidatus Aminicenantales bacterium]